MESPKLFSEAGITLISNAVVTQLLCETYRPTLLKDIAAKVENEIPAQEYSKVSNGGILEPSRKGKCGCISGNLLI